MKPNLPIAQLLILMVFIFLSCQKEEEHNIVKSPYTGSEEIIVSQADCKVFPVNAEKSLPGSDQSCIEYDYDAQTGDLQLKHVNSGFNCCPGVLYVLVYVSNDTILIEESEKEQACLCLCLFDININIPGIASGQYHLKFVEPYCGNQPKLEFNIDLSHSTQDIYCVSRTEYPWGVSN